MALNTPGLAPRKLEGEVDNSRIIDKLPDPPTEIEKPSIDTKAESVQASDNTKASVQPTDNNVETQAQDEQPLTNRAEERIKSLDERAKTAEARAAQAEALAQQQQAMLARLVNVQTQQPAQSAQEVLAKQYKTFNPSLGYPEDPREYANFVAANARAEAQQEAQKQTAQLRVQQEAIEFTRAFPNAQQDPDFMGAVAARQAYARGQGAYLSLKDAGDLVTKSFNDRASKKAVADVATNDRSKDEAYVESTRGASTASRTAGSTPDVDKMSLAEMEAFLRKNNAW